MEPVLPTTGGEPLVIAKNQPEYIALPARYENGVVTTLWNFSFEERRAIMDGARLVLKISTFGLPLQPLLPYIEGGEPVITERTEE